MSGVKAGRRASEAELAAAAEWVVRIQSVDATEADFTAWEEWIADPEHSAAYSAVEEIWMLTPQVKPVPWPSREELDAEANAEEPKAGVRKFFGRRPVALATAASLLIALPCAWFVWPVSPTILQTATAEQRSVRLADGSQVTLAAETRLVVELHKDQRDIRMEKGEAYFEVAHDAQRPFVVHAQGHEAVAVGTAFDVEANAERMTVTVTQGTVELAAVRLEVGERATADGGGVHRLPAVPRPEAVAAWREGRLEYLHASLRTVVEDVNRYTDRKIIVADESVGALQFTGTVILNDLDAWLMALPTTFPVEIVNRNGKRVLKHVAGRMNQSIPTSRAAAEP